MKKTSLILANVIILLSLCFTACNKYSTYPEDIIGTWILVDHNTEELTTNNISVFNFYPEQKEVFAARHEVANGFEWIELPENTYTLDKNIIVGEGIDHTGTAFSYEAVITIDGDKMIFDVIKDYYGGVPQEQKVVLTLEKTKVDYKNEIIGLWKGKETTEGVTDNEYKYWEYFEDGTFNYYYFDTETNGYILKEDNNGVYFTYGDLFVSNYSNDIITGNEGRESESWIISINDNTMTWTALRDGGKTASFEMERAEVVE